MGVFLIFCVIVKLGKVLQKSAETVKKYSESVELAYPKDAQDPSVLRSYSLKLQRVIRVRSTFLVAIFVRFLNERLENE